ncbi:unnamed protein product [Adineta steineri]|uniref:NAD-dependent epimerase/dehydratase domain-containing protein n=1 Tax=Adineta steineri TaxID=433720 RepID=A0A815D800_9BILA|nr:unnamed protein product [Adineta steineri]CAF1293481.1 unnamed protein product [Adineta steineri]CAF4052030.1 unnamed protein product [Adineta steineri]CAF4100378.1 unnamed protein product [Adineta steineri]
MPTTTSSSTSGSPNCHSHLPLRHTSSTLDNSVASWRSAIATEWNVRRAADKEKECVLFPLAMNPFGEDEIIAMTEVLLTGRLTLGPQVEKAEKKFAEVVGIPYVVMVNSGSSANLLAVSAITNKLRPIHCEPGDEVLVPAVCWSTSVFPLLQNGLRPIFVDVDPRTFNVTLAELERKITPRVKAVMAVHVLGNSIDMRQMMTFVTRHKLMLIEDTCESLGSFCETDTGNERQMLGTFGDFGTFSFYFSHHITSGEGGMITCKTEEDYNLLRCLRAHGWTRHLTNRNMVEELYPDIDSRFLFVNIGYNLRPLEVQGAMLSVQIDKLSQFNACRRDNLKRIREIISRNERFHRLMSLMEASPGVDPAWFGVGILLHRPYAHQRHEFLKYLEENGIENRPIISGNFIRQPCIASFCEQEHPENYPGAEVIHKRGFFIGIHQIALDQTVIEKLVEIMLAFPFQPQHVIVVTGSHRMLGKYIRNIILKQTLEEETVSSKLSSPENKIKTKNSEWIFLTQDDGDLRQIEDVTNIFRRFQPTRILHCAAYIASNEDMYNKPVDFWLDNVKLNNNILQIAFEFQLWSGPIKVISILSANIFLENTQHLKTESYIFAQRSLQQLIRWYRQQHNCSFISLLSDNVFGAYEDLNTDIDQFVNTLIMKIVSQQEVDPSTSVVLTNTCTTECEILFAHDYAKIIVWAMDNYDEDETLLVSGQTISILELVQLICQHANFVGGFTFDNNVEYSRLLYDTNSIARLNPPIQMTSLSTAIQHTVEWYRNKKCKESII